MSPELINAIKDRIQNGHTKESIKNEVLAMGHTEALFEAAYILAEHDISEAHARDAIVSGTAMTLTPVHTLVKDALSFVCNRWGMVVLLGAPLILIALLTELQTYFTENPLMIGMLSGISIVAMIFYFVNILVVLYLVSRGSELERNSYTEAFRFTKKNIFGIFFVYLLTMLTVLGGFILFVIPGFVVLISLYFSQYIFVVEGKRGMSALERSRAIVKGRWWQVLKKIIGLTLYFLIPVFIASLIVGIIGTFHSIEKFALVGEVILQIATAFFTVLSMHVMFRIYRELAESTTEMPSKKGVRAAYWLLTSVGLITIPTILILLVVFGEVDELKETMTPLSQDNHVVLQMDELDKKAEEYFVNQKTLEGVCESLINSLSTDGGVACNDDIDSWALSVVDGEDVWCMDSKQAVPKRIRSEIDERTACIVVE